MKFDFLFILVALVSYCASLISLQGGLSNGAAPCPAMETGFNTSTPNVFYKLNGTIAYTCFAITDPSSGTPPVWDTNSLNYHLVPGLHPLSSLPIDGILQTDKPNDTIRITKFNGIYYANGRVPLPTSYGEGYYDGSVITNGIMYKFQTPAGIDYPKQNATTRKTIMQGLTDLSSIIKSTIASQFFQIGISNLISPPVSWTLFVPSDNAFVGVPQYRLDYIMNTQSAAYSFLLTHAFNGTTFGYPLSLSNVNPVYTMTSLNGLNYNFSYFNYGGDEPTWLLQPENKPDSDQLNIVDGMRKDGVVQSLSAFYLPPDWSWPLPSLKEFIEQFSSFTQPIITELVGFYFNGVEDMIADIKASGITITADMTIFLIRKQDYAQITDVSLLEYHIIPGKYLAADLPLNEFINTANNGTSIRIVNYEDTLLINGYSKVTIKDIKLGDGIIHILNAPLSLPVESTDACVSCYKDITILEDLATDPTLSAFYNFMLNPPITIEAPYTIIVPSDTIDFGNIAKLNAYLAKNITALQEYMKELLFDGLLYPSLAQNQEIEIQSISGINYTFQYNDPDPTQNQIYPTLSFITSTNTGSVGSEARPRKDGIYYVSKEYLFNFPIPPPPPAPLPEPAPFVPQGVLPPDDSSAHSNYLSNLFLLLGFLVVLFLQ